MATCEDPPNPESMHPYTGCHISPATSLAGIMTKSRSIIRGWGNSNDRPRRMMLPYKSKSRSMVLSDHRGPRHRPSRDSMHWHRSSKPRAECWVRTRTTPFRNNPLARPTGRLIQVELLATTSVMESESSMRTANARILRRSPSELPKAISASVWVFKDSPRWPVPRSVFFAEPGPHSPSIAPVRPGR